MMRVGDPTGWMSSETRRRVAQLYDRLDRLLDADRNFYRRFPNRTWRIRRAFPEEVQMMALASPADSGLPSRLAWFVAVVQDRPGLRLRMFFCTDRGLDTDLSEAETADVLATIRTHVMVTDYEAAE